jgi:hypothetical protein
MAKGKRWPAVAALLLLAGTGPAAAAEYCVTCEAPNALYRCVIQGTPDGAGTDPGASLLCISEMAARGHHESCAVARGAPVPCPGLTAMVTQRSDMPAMASPPPGAIPPPAAAAEGMPPPPEGQENAASAPEEPAKVPRTMEELAGQTVKSSKENLEKAGQHIGNAGSAIGNAASKTWTCIMSLFSTCGGNSESAD